MMKKLFSLLLLLTLLFALPAVAENDRLLHVSGNASISLPADTAQLQIGVETSDTDINAAQRKNTILMNQVIEKLLEAGVAREDMITTNFNVYSYPNEGMTVYNISNTLSVTVKNLAQVGRMMDTAVQSGANQMYGLTFSSTKQKEAYEKALRRAVDDAKAKAQILADAAGVSLQEIVAVDARDLTPSFGINNVYEAEGKDADMPIISGDVEVSASVTLTYKIN